MKNVAKTGIRLVKVKDKLVPVLNSLSALPWRRVGEWRYSSTLLDLLTRRRWVISSTPRPLYPAEKAPNTHWVGNWVGPGAGLDDVEKRNISCICRESNHRRPAHSLSLYRLRYPGSRNTLEWDLRETKTC
jgi:hypothetical protein